MGALRWRRPRAARRSVAAVFQDRNHSDLWLTLLPLFGHDDPTFGVPDFCSGPLSGVAT